MGDDVQLRLAPRHHSACCLGVLDGARPAQHGETRLAERIEKTRIKTRVGMGRHSRSQRRGDAERHHQTSHHHIITHIGAVVVSTQAGES